jgi:TolA-binding protein
VGVGAIEAGGAAGLKSEDRAMIRSAGVAMAAAWVVATQGTTLRAAEPQDARIQELAARVQQLEQRVRQLEELILPSKDDLQARARSARLRRLFEARQEQDQRAYSVQEREEIERLYQVANRQWNSPEARDSLKQLTDKYAKANRTGCALLYLGQMATGEEKEGYLKRAIAGFSDCWYGDGVQVGSYARFHLAVHYRQSGRAAEAAALFDEILSIYPDAIDHKGNLLADLILRNP